ncbi:MAG TPA: CocE/NonD family hydrolase [Solirubrobacteraceae bacterium]
MRRRAGLAALVSTLALLTGSPAAHARDVVVTSFDGTPIVAHFYTSSVAKPGERDPTVLVGSGYPESANTKPDVDTSDIVGLAALRGAGYNVLTWDPRGLGGSGGVLRFNSPDYEVRDVQALIDWVATQPEALLDGPGDPRIGMSGSSYGGAIQLLVAARDPRVDAIVPDISYNSPADGFAPAGDVKTSWLTQICSLGTAVSYLPTGDEAGLQLGGQDPQLTSACAQGVLGSLSAASTRFFAARSVEPFLKDIRAPTLISQGTVDVLFGPSAGIANFEGVRAGGAPVKMMWRCGGHGKCPTPSSDQLHVTLTALAWLHRWLDRDPSVDTGPVFEWQDDSGTWRHGVDFPLASTGTLDASGSGTLAISPADSAGSGVLLEPIPAVNAVTADFPAPAADSTILGAPALTLTYHGIATVKSTYLYAQLVDTVNDRVVDDQVTPLPVVLDGRTRTLQRSLETIAIHGEPSSRYRLQITGGSPVFALQRAIGAVTIGSVSASLPIVDPDRSGRPPAAAPLVLPKRLRLRVSSRRDGHASRLVVRSRLRSAPCMGVVTVTARAGRAVRSVRTHVRRDCTVRAVLRLAAARGRHVRVGARFAGNGALAARRARSVVRRLR